MYISKSVIDWVIILSLGMVIWNQTQIMKQLIDIKKMLMKIREVSSEDVDID